MRRIVVWGVAILVMAAAVLAAGGYIYLRRSLPLVDGSVEVTGVTAQVEIVRDRNAVPHIFASTREDALFGLGYVHAQDRLWQMEFQRRVGHGRLSEIFGNATIREDRFLRTVGFGRAAKAALDRLPPDAKTQIDAYVSGVNAFISTHRGSRLPPEFTLLRFEPEPWTPVDVVVWSKMMAWDLSANYQLELLRHDLAARVGIDRMHELMPPYPADAPSIVPPGVVQPAVPTESMAPDHTGAVSKQPAAEPLTDAFASALDSPIGRWLLTRSEGLGSNNWVVDGTMTASGKPLLANDPHLAPHIPSLWYLAHLKAGDFEIIGATLPGTPAVAIGRNRFIAWGETNVAADVEDFYRERLDPQGQHAEFRGALEPLTIVKETIHIKGAADLIIDVRATRHGPLVSDAINANNAANPAGPPGPPLEPLAFRWTALDNDDTTLAAFFQLHEARNWRDFTAALRQFVVPSQNFVYADVEGHIGYYAPGRIPIRANGDGSLPAEGWTGDAEWTGWIPFEELPHLYDPPQHFIATANHKPSPDGYPYLIGLEYPDPYRINRITALLRSSNQLTPDDFRAIQGDSRSLHARALLPTLLELVEPVEDRGREAVRLLRNWDYDAAGSSVAAAIFEAWFLRLTPRLVEDDLGEALTNNYEGRFSFLTRFILATVKNNNNRWCDNGNTPEPESCRFAVSTAFYDALEALTDRLGPDMSAWRWDGVHRAVFPHQGLSTVTGLGWFLNRSIPNGGDFSTINVAPVAPDRPYEQREVASYRQIIDLSSLNDSRFLDTTGQSGHVLSRYYDDSIKDWQALRHRPMLMQRKAIDDSAIGRLLLAPKH